MYTVIAHNPSNRFNSAMTLVQKLRALLTRRDKKILILILFSTILASILEVGALSFTMIFISAVIKFRTLHTGKVASYLFKLTGPLTNVQIVLLLGLCLIGFYVMRCILTIIHTYFMQRFLENRKQLLTSQFFQNYLRFNYHDFTEKNPATINKLVFQDAMNVMQVVSSSIMIFAEVFTLSLIYASLIFINWKMTVVLTVLLSSLVIFILKTFSRQMAANGSIVVTHTRNIGQLYNESFRNFKLVKLLGHENYILSRFKKENQGLINAQVMNRVLQEIPRLVLETIGFSILSGAVIYVVYKVQTPEYVIPILSMYALAFYRFMPSTTKIMNAYNQMLFAKGQLDLSSDLMYKSKALGSEKIAFSKAIQLKNVSFGYLEDKNIFTNTTMTINKQERIAFIGESGAGKSTLADILMGFYPPKQGAIYIDDQKITNENIRSWRNKIGYIPQQIYLFDGTVADNIVFGRHYDEKKVIAVLKKSKRLRLFATS